MSPVPRKLKASVSKLAKQVKEGNSPIPQANDRFKQVERERARPAPAQGADLKIEDEGIAVQT